MIEIGGFSVNKKQVDLGRWHAEGGNQLTDRRLPLELNRERSLPALRRQVVVEFFVEAEFSCMYLFVHKL